jgi:hypothetical protein
MAFHPSSGLRHQERNEWTVCPFRAARSEGRGQQILLRDEADPLAVPRREPDKRAGQEIRAL